MFTTLALALLACTAATAPPSEPEMPVEVPIVPATGNWHAWLDSPGGALPFGLEISEGDTGWQAWILNPPERIAVDAVRLEDNTLVLDFAHYDARVLATWSKDGHQLDGHWEKAGTGDTVDSLPFHAKWGAHDRFSEVLHDGPMPPLAPRWSVDFSSSDAVAVGLFTQQGRIVSGTFLTDTGDYRFLSGTLDGRQLRLSVFDGAHAFLFHATLDDKGMLTGDFWSRQAWHETWTATPSPTVSLADPMSLTQIDEAVDWSAHDFPDLQGASRTLADAEWANRPHLIQIMGTWCPNCGDSTAFLKQVRAQYPEDALGIVSLAFEHTGNLARDTAVVRTYKAHHGTSWTYLVAGLSDKDKASAALPFLDQVHAYPTVLFVRTDGSVAAIHTGFAGPAAPHANASLRDTYTRQIDALLATP